MNRPASVADRPPPATARRRPLILASAMMVIFMAAVEATIVATAMPTIVGQLGGFHLFSWVFAAYLLAQAITIPIYGRLADLYGRKPVLFVGTGVFLLGSTLCGIAHSMAMLVAFRGLQGLGAGAIQPIAMTIVGDIYSPTERAKIQGYLSSVWGVSAIAGPGIGAFIVEHLAWPIVFWVNIPIGIAAVAMLSLFLHERRERKDHQIDYAGGALLAIATGAFMIVLIQGAALGLAPSAALLALSALATAFLLRVERGAKEPLLPLQLWRSPIIAIGSGGGLIIGATMMGIAAFLPVYVQGVMGRDAATTGFALAVMSLGWPLGSVIAGRLMIRTSYRLTATAGGCALVLGSLVMALLRPGYSPIWAGIGAFLVGMGMGFANTTFLVSIQTSVEWSKRGIATSAAMFARLAGQSLGTAMLGAILNVSLHRTLNQADTAIDRLLDPTLRGAIPTTDLAQLVATVAAALHNVFIGATVLAIIAIVLARRLPSGVGPLHPAKTPRG